ncbi:hypothetical protein N658DRAFT_486755 [Parathielavia hyrcaniae]|uniref:Uncharacterized protein n=1 Tax=Parathielavia hyrcaniae TaxID=113614 RepID=A0AAN6T0D0_9PEZI|nr:hypothetical protein N658DRAFT_486755 [Parathielavia hyrcaniae]
MATTTPKANNTSTGCKRLVNAWKAHQKSQRRQLGPKDPPNFVHLMLARESGLNCDVKTIREEGLNCDVKTIREEGLGRLKSDRKLLRVLEDFNKSFSDSSKGAGLTVEGNEEGDSEGSDAEGEVTVEDCVGKQVFGLIMWYRYFERGLVEVEEDLEEFEALCGVEFEEGVAVVEEEKLEEFQALCRVRSNTGRLKAHKSNNYHRHGWLTINGALTPPKRLVKPKPPSSHTTATRHSIMMAANSSHNNAQSRDHHVKLGSGHDESNTYPLNVFADIASQQEYLSVTQPPHGGLLLLARAADKLRLEFEQEKIEDCIVVRPL